MSQRTIEKLLICEKATSHSPKWSSNSIPISSHAFINALHSNLVHDVDVDAILGRPSGGLFAEFVAPDADGGFVDAVDDGVGKALDDDACLYVRLAIYRLD